MEEIDTTLSKFWGIEAVNMEEPVMTFGSRSSCTGKSGKVIEVGRRSLSSSYSVERQLVRVARQFRNGVQTTSVH